MVGSVVTRVPPAQALQEDRSRKISSRFNARLLSMTSIRGILIKGFLLGKLNVFCLENSFSLMWSITCCFLLRNAEGKIALSTKTCQAAKLYIECNTEICQNCKTCVPPQALKEDISRKISSRFNARLLSMTSIRGILFFITIFFNHFP